MDDDSYAQISFCDENIWEGQGQVSVVNLTGASDDNSDYAITTAYETKQSRRVRFQINDTDGVFVNVFEYAPVADWSSDVYTTTDEEIQRHKNFRKMASKLRRENSQKIKYLEACYTGGKRDTEASTFLVEWSRSELRGFECFFSHRSQEQVLSYIELVLKFQDTMKNSFESDASESLRRHAVSHSLKARVFAIRMAKADEFAAAEL